MAHCKSWEVSDEFWAIVELLIPARKRDVLKAYAGRCGGGRKPFALRKVFDGIVYVLRTGIQSKALSKERFGSSSFIHKYFQQWEHAGFSWSFGNADWPNMMTCTGSAGNGKVSTAIC